MTMYNVAVIGFGYWGQNIVRNFDAAPNCQVKYICDKNMSCLESARGQYPHAELISDSEIAFLDPSIQVIAIVTPVASHYVLAKRALECGKHLFVEKPMVQTSAQAEDLIRIAEEKNLVGVVDHTFLFTGAVQKIKEIIDSGEIGEMLYFDSVRVNLGLFQHDVDVIWDLTPHDLSILFHLYDEGPSSVFANGSSHFNSELIDIGYLMLKFRSSMIANFHVNWLSPIKVRKILIGGSKKMIVYDDMETSEKIKIYDSGVSIRTQEEARKVLVDYRTGDMTSPKISNTEALAIEIRDFLRNISLRQTADRNSLDCGGRVVSVLEASQKSLQEKSWIRL